MTDTTVTVEDIDLGKQQKICFCLLQKKKKFSVNIKPPKMRLMQV